MPGLAGDEERFVLLASQHTLTFQEHRPWKSAADFKTQTGTEMGGTGYQCLFPPALRGR